MNGKLLSSVLAIAITAGVSSDALAAPRGRRGNRSATRATVTFGTGRTAPRRALPGRRGRRSFVRRRPYYRSNRFASYCAPRRYYRPIVWPLRTYSSLWVWNSSSDRVRLNDLQVQTNDAYQAANTVIINVYNSNGSITPVKLTRQGNVFVGPRGEQYFNLPTVDQLAPVYGF